MAATNIEAMVTGKVWKIEMAVGERAEIDDVLMIIESMKMEIPVQIPQSGTVVAIMVNEGDAVSEGQIVAMVE